jgi:hypothetical protein
MRRDRAAAMLANDSHSTRRVNTAAHHEHVNRCSDDETRGHTSKRRHARTNHAQDARHTEGKQTKKNKERRRGERQKRRQLDACRTSSDDERCTPPSHCPQCAWTARHATPHRAHTPSCTHAHTFARSHTSARSCPAGLRSKRQSRGLRLRSFFVLPL